MTKFTKEEIEMHRLQLSANVNNRVWNYDLAVAALDEIEKLQKENKELKDTIRNYVLDYYVGKMRDD